MGDKYSDSEHDTQQETAGSGAQGQDPSPGQETSREDGTEALTGQDVLLAMQEENAKIKDRLLRAAADMENLRKRTQREVSDARSYAIADFARDMLNATDNLVRALDAIPEELRQSSDPATKSLIEGIEMTEREMQRLMQKNGVRPIQAEGEKFDPHKHQAMFEVPDPSVPAGLVVQVVQQGFEIGDRVLRPAMVGVSKGGPKMAAPSENPAQNGKDEAGETAGTEDTPDTSVHIDRQV